MARLKGAVDQAGGARQGEGGLGDEPGGVGPQPFGVFVALFGGGVGAYQHTVAAGAVNFLYHQIGEVVQRVLQIFRAAAEVGFYVLQQRLFVQIVADHIRHVDVDAFVVGDAGAGGVGEGDVAQLGGVDEAADAQHGIGLEYQGVQVFVVDAAVEYIHLAEALGGAHIEQAVADGQIAALHQFGADFAGQEHMLVEGRVVDAGGQQGQGGVGLAAGGQFAEGGLQCGAVAFDFPHPRAAVEPGQAGFGRLAVGDHIGYAGGDAQVVFQHAEAVVGADDVGAADGDPDAVGGREILHFFAELGALAHHILGDDAVVDDAALAVDVFQEIVERPYPLGKAGVQFAPVGGGNHAGDGVYRDDALFRFGVAVDGERDAFVGESPVDAALDAGQVVGRQPEQLAVQPLGVGPGLAVGQKHFVVNDRV